MNHFYLAMLFALGHAGCAPASRLETQTSDPARQAKSPTTKVVGSDRALADGDPADTNVQPVDDNARNGSVTIYVEEDEIVLRWLDALAHGQTTKALDSSDLPFQLVTTNRIQSRYEGLSRTREELGKHLEMMRVDEHLLVAELAISLDDPRDRRSMSPIPLSRARASPKESVFCSDQSLRYLRSTIRGNGVVFSMVFGVSSTERGSRVRRVLIDVDFFE